MLFARSPAARSYRFVARVAGHGLPAVEKAIRLRCTLSAADRSIVGVSSLVLPLGPHAECEQTIELVHDANGDAPPCSFEMVAVLAPPDTRAARFVPWPGDAASDNPYEYRVAGTIEASRAYVELPDIVLRGA